MIRVVSPIKAMSKFTIAVSKLILSNLSFLESRFFLLKFITPLQNGFLVNICFNDRYEVQFTVSNSFIEFLVKPCISYCNGLSKLQCKIKKFMAKQSATIKFFMVLTR